MSKGLIFPSMWHHWIHEKEVWTNKGCFTVISLSLSVRGGELSSFGFELRIYFDGISLLHWICWHHYLPNVWSGLLIAGIQQQLILQVYKSVQFSCTSWFLWNPKTICAYCAICSRLYIWIHTTQNLHVTHATLFRNPNKKVSAYIYAKAKNYTQKVEKNKGVLVKHYSMPPAATKPKKLF